MDSTTSTMPTENGMEQTHENAHSDLESHPTNWVLLQNYQHPYANGSFEFRQRPGLTEPQSTAASCTAWMPVASKYGINLVIGFMARVASGISKVSIPLGPGAIQIEFGRAEMFQDSLHLEFVEDRKVFRFRRNRRPSQSDTRNVQASELTKGWGNLIDLTGCSFTTSATTMTQTSIPIELPFRSLRCVMRLLGFDIAYAGPMDIVFGTRVGRDIKAALAISAMVDPFGNDSVTSPLDFQEDNHVLKTRIKATVTDKVSDVVHEVKSRFKETLFSDNARKSVHRRLRSRNGYLLIM